MFGWIVVILGRTIKSPGKQQISEQKKRNKAPIKLEIFYHPMIDQLKRLDLQYIWAGLEETTRDQVSNN